MGPGAAAWGRATDIRLLGNAPASDTPAWGMALELAVIVCEVGTSLGDSG